MFSQASQVQTSFTSSSETISSITRNDFFPQSGQNKSITTPHSADSHKAILRAKEIMTITQAAAIAGTQSPTNNRTQAETAFGFLVLQHNQGNTGNAVHTDAQKELLNYR